MASFESVEIIDYVAARKLFDNWEDIPFINEKRENMGDTKEALKKYLLHRTGPDNDKCNISMSYVYGKEKIHGLKGRQISRFGGLQSLQREVRQTLAHNFYDDIDMSNAITHILIGFCNRNEIICDNLKNYAEHREEILNGLMTAHAISREYAKKAIIKLMMGGGKFIKIAGTGERKKMNSEPINKLYDDAQKILKFVSEDEHWKNAMDQVKIRRKKNGKEYNFAGGLVADIVFSEENKILMNAISFLKKENKSVKNIVLVFDGFMIPKSERCASPNFLKRLSDYVSKESGYNITFLSKEMSEIVDLSKFEVKEEFDEIFRKKIYTCKDIKQCAEIVCNTLRDKIKVCEGVLWMKWETHGIWTDNMKDIKMALVDKVSGMTFMSSEGKGGRINGTRHANVEIFESMCDTLANDESYADRKFYSNVIKDTVDKIFFKNGYIELIDDGKWIMRNNIDVSEDQQRTFIRIDRDLPDLNKVSAESKEILNNKILNPIFGSDELCNNYLEHLARAITCHYEDKHGVITCSARNSGKGIIAKLTRNAFENYVDEINADSFIIEKLRTAHDARKYAFLYDNRHCHIIFANEAATGDGETQLYWDGVMFKRFLSGGDFVKVRPLYANETKIKPHFRLFVMCNDLPQLKPADALLEMSYITLPHHFIKRDEYDDMKALLDKENEINRKKHNALTKMNPNIMLADDTIKDLCDDQGICDAFILRILQSYKRGRVVDCAKVKSDTRQLCIDMCEETSVVKSKIKYTGIKTHHVLISELSELVRNDGMFAGFTIPKLKAKIVQMGGEYSKNISITDASGNKRAVRGYRNIKMRDPEEEDVDDIDEIRQPKQKKSDGKPQIIKETSKGHKQIDYQDEIDDINDIDEIEQPTQQKSAIKLEIINKPAEGHKLIDDLGDFDDIATINQSEPSMKTIIVP